MIDKCETIDELIQYYHRLWTVTVNTYLQVFEHNPFDRRIIPLVKTCNRYAWLFNMYVELRDKRGSRENRKPPL